MAKTNLKKGRLSNDDFETFKANIHLSDKQLADKLSRNVNFIENTRNRVYPNKKTGKWSKADVIMLQENCNNMSIKELSRLLNRAEKAIKSKIKTIDIAPVDTAREIPTVPTEEREVLNEGVPENPYMEKEIVTEEDCCGEDCCDHENKAKVSFWTKLINFFKVW